MLLSNFVTPSGGGCELRWDTALIPADDLEPSQWRTLEDSNKFFQDFSHGAPADLKRPF